MNYFFLITLQGDRRSTTLTGTHPQPPGETREQAFASILTWAMEQTGITSPVVLHFSLEPNQLGSAA